MFDTQSHGRVCLKFEYLKTYRFNHKHTHKHLHTQTFLFDLLTTYPLSMSVECKRFEKWNVRKDSTTSWSGVSVGALSLPHSLTIHNINVSMWHRTQLKSLTRRNEYRPSKTHSLYIKPIFIDLLFSTYPQLRQFVEFFVFTFVGQSHTNRFKRLALLIK